MLAKEVELLPGMPITSPGGRRLEVGEIFVPKHDLTKSRVLPPSFRGLGRKVVVFRDGSIAPLAEVKQRFHCIINENTSNDPNGSGSSDARIIDACIKDTSAKDISTKDISTISFINDDSDNNAANRTDRSNTACEQ